MKSLIETHTKTKLQANAKLLNYCKKNAVSNYEEFIMHLKQYNLLVEETQDLLIYKSSANGEVLKLDLTEPNSKLDKADKNKILITKKDFYKIYNKHFNTSYCYFWDSIIDNYSYQVEFFENKKKTNTFYFKFIDYENDIFVSIRD